MWVVFLSNRPLLSSNGGYAAVAAPETMVFIRHRIENPHRSVANEQHAVADKYLWADRRARDTPDACLHEGCVQSHCKIHTEGNQSVMET